MSSWALNELSVHAAPLSLGLKGPLGHGPSFQLETSLQRLDDRSTQAVWEAALAELSGHRVDLRATLDDRTLSARSAQSRLGFGPVEAWERNTSFDGGATVEFAGGRLRGTSRVAASHYDAPRAGFAPSKRPDRKKDKDLERFAGVDEAFGDAVLQSLEATLVEEGALRLAVFGQYSAVDRWFESAALLDPGDPFLNPGHDALEGGATLTLGPVTVAFGLSDERDLLDDEGRDAPRRSSYRRARAELALVDALSGIAADAVWLPTTLWFSTDRGEIRPEGPGVRQNDHGRSWGIGATWSNAAVEAHLGYWSETYDSGGPATVDSTDETLEFGFGLYRESWDVYVGLGVGRYEYATGGTRAVDHSMDVSVGAGLRRDRLPDLYLSVTASHYAAEYPSDATFGRYGNWEVDANLDFTKFLPDQLAPSGVRLSLIYGMGAYRNWDGYSGSDRGIEHAVGILATLPLQ